MARARATHRRASPVRAGPRDAKSSVLRTTVRRRRRNRPRRSCSTHPGVLPAIRARQVRSTCPRRTTSRNRDLRGRLEQATSAGPCGAPSRAWCGLENRSSTPHVGGHHGATSGERLTTTGERRVRVGSPISGRTSTSFWSADPSACIIGHPRHGSPDQTMRQRPRGVTL